MRTLWFRALLALAAVWLVAGAVMLWARQSQTTPESLGRYLTANTLDGKSPADREKVIRRVADQLNQLPYESRRDVRRGKQLDEYFKGMNPDEQGRFLDATLPMGFKQMMDSLNKMLPEKRRDIVDKALKQMEKDGGVEGEEPPGKDDPNIQKIVQQGLRSFYNDASADVKMDFAPLLEQMQKGLQGR